MSEAQINNESEEINLETTKNMYFTFEIDNEDYGVEIVNIKEIIPIPPITKVPHAPQYLRGIINLRGDIIPVIDVRERFGKLSKEYDALTCIIVIEYGLYSLGLIVDSVKEVLYIDEDKVAPPPSAKLNSVNKFIKNIGRTDTGVKLLLDLDRVLDII